jgi:hypothetical protein
MVTRGHWCDSVVEVNTSAQGKSDYVDNRIEKEVELLLNKISWLQNVG